MSFFQDLPVLFQSSFSETIDEPPLIRWYATQAAVCGSITQSRFSSDKPHGSDSMVVSNDFKEKIVRVEMLQKAIVFLGTKGRIRL